MAGSSENNFSLKFNYNLIKTCHPLEGIFLSSMVLIVFNITYYIKEASGMLNIPFGLALIDTLALIEEAFSKKTRNISVSF